MNQCLCGKTEKTKIPKKTELSDAIHFLKKLPLFFKAVSENQSNRVRMTEVFYITYPAFSVSFQFETRLCIILQEEMQHCARDEMVSRLHF